MLVLFLIKKKNNINKFLLFVLPEFLQIRFFEYRKSSPRSIPSQLEYKKSECVFKNSNQSISRASHFRPTSGSRYVVFLGFFFFFSNRLRSPVTPGDDKWAE